MRMDEIGYHHKHENTFCINRPNGAGDWLFLIIKTPAVFKIDGEYVPVKADSFILYTPEYPEHYSADSNCEEYIDDWIHFSPDESEEKLMRELSIPFNTAIYLGEISSISNIVRNMCHEFYSANLHRKDSVNLYFRMLIYKLHEQLERVHPVSVLNESSYCERLIWIRECIFRRPGFEWSIDELSKELSISRSRFQHLYSDTFGVSIMQDIITSRVQYAAELLKYPDISIDRISEICGYSSVSYFIRQFKKINGVTPAQYRKRF